MQEARENGTFTQNVEFICYVNTESPMPKCGGEESKQENQEEGSQDNAHQNEEFRKRLIENNFDLMNGVTIQVVTSRGAIPSHFVEMDDLDQIKSAVAHDLDQ